MILASASPRRQELLRDLGLDFEVVPAPVTEWRHPDLTARELCLANAHRKAESVARRYPEALVLSADTLVCLGTSLFGKPANLTEARRMLRQLQGRTHQVVTAVCLLHGATWQERLFAEMTDVAFRRLSASRINRYLAAVNPLDKAGAYAIQEHGDLIVERVSGSYSNVVGLPVERLRRELGMFWPGLETRLANAGTSLQRV